MRVKEKPSVPTLLAGPPTDAKKFEQSVKLERTIVFTSVVYENGGDDQGMTLVVLMCYR